VRENQRRSKGTDCTVQRRSPVSRILPFTILQFYLWKRHGAERERWERRKMRVLLVVSVLIRYFSLYLI
jgi:hypothetical protein